MSSSHEQQSDAEQQVRVAFPAILKTLQAFVVVGGLVSFTGWVADVPRFTDWDGYGISIQPNTTIAVTCAGLALVLYARGLRRASAVLGGLVALIGGTVILQHLLRIDLGIDTLVMFDREWERRGVLSPGRMGPPGATSWTLIGIGIVLASLARGPRTRRVVPALALITALISALGLVGYVYGASTLYSLPRVTVIALQTAAFIFSVSIGLLLCVPEHGPMRLLLDKGPAGVLARRIAPTVLLVPFVIGLVRVMGERAQFYDTAFGSALRTILEIVLLTVFLWWTGNAIHRQARRRAEADRESRVSQQRVVDTLESITDAFVTFDREWRFAYVNAEAERLLARNREVLLGKSAWDAFPEMVGGHGYNELHRAAAQRISVTFEEFNPVTQRWFANKAYPTADGEMAVYFEDVTVRKQAEDELALNRSQLEAELGDTRLLHGMSTELIVQEDSQRFYDSLLDAAVRIMRSDFATLQLLHPERGRAGELFLLAQRGLSPEAAKHWEWVSVDSPSSCGAALRSGKRAIIRDVELVESIAGSSAISMYREVGLRAAQTTPLVSRGGSLLGMISTHWRVPHEPPERELRLLDILARQAADLIERKRSGEMIAELNRQLTAELAAMTRMHEVSSRLVQSTEFTALLREIIDAAVSITDADMGNIQLLDGNTLKFAVHHGFNAEFVEFFDAVHGGSAACGTALTSAQRVIVEDITASPIFAGTPALDVLTISGVRAVQSTPLIGRSGNVVGVLSTHYRNVHRPSQRELRMLDLLARQAADVLERRLTERQREVLLEAERSARADAERAARLKDEFLATLSHELRTPLNAIIGWSHILKKDILDSEKVRTAVEVIERNGRLQAQLITDLLDISRIISGKMRLDVQAVELPAVIESAVDSVMPAAEAKGVRIQRVIEPIVEPINGDPARLQQVVWNLLSNAVKFTPRGGRVQVVLARVNSHVEIRVSDSGEGITPEFLPHIFERFRQADASASRPHGGLGLGLAIVKQFVELHGGRVRATSDGVGKGATFVIELPLVLLSEGERALSRLHPKSAFIIPTPVESTRLQGLRVLVVDDELDALEMLRRMLEDCGAHVGGATSADSALELLARDTFDVLVSDIGMPRRDGYDLISEVRARGYELPALALTAFARAEDRTKAMTSGYQAHVSKPVDTGELLATLGALVGKRARPDDAGVSRGCCRSIVMTAIPDLSAKQMARALPARVRKRLMRGRFESGADIAALRRFIDLTQAEFARAMGISVHTLRNWEQDRRRPDGSAIALLRIAARHPRILRENLGSAA